MVGGSQLKLCHEAAPAKRPWQALVLLLVGRLALPFGRR